MKLFLNEDDAQSRGKQKDFIKGELIRRLVGMLDKLSKRENKSYKEVHLALSVQLTLFHHRGSWRRI